MTVDRRLNGDGKSQRLKLGEHTFEHEQEIVSKLLVDNAQFRSLYNRHSLLKQQVKDAEAGEAGVDHFQLGAMKKEKLLAKDQMAAIIAQHQREIDGHSSTA